MEKLFGNDLFIFISSSCTGTEAYIWNGTQRGESTYYSLSAVPLQPKQSELLTDIICAELLEESFWYAEELTSGLPL